MGRRFRDVYTPPQYYIYNSKNNRWPATPGNIQTAIDDLDNGGKVCLPRGTFPLTATIELYDLTRKIVIEGHGKETVLSVATDIDIFHLYSSVAPYGAAAIAGHVIRDLKLLGYVGHTACGIHMADAGKYGIHYSKFENLFFERLGWGIYFESGQSDNCMILHNQFTLMEDMAVYLAGAAEENNIIGNNIDNSHSATKGIYSSGQRNAIIGNVIEEVGMDSGLGDGIHLGSEEDVCLGNTVRESGRYGIIVAGIDQTVIGNLVNDNQNHGIYVQNTGHRVIGNVATDNTGDNIRVVGGDTHGQNVLIAQNKVSGAGAVEINDLSGIARVIDNTGWNPRAASTPAVGATPATFGPYDYPACIEIVGNVTSVTVRGQISALPANVNFIGCWPLYPGDTCVIVYPAGAPTVTLWPQ